MAGDAGLILTCAGCCRGHPAHGGALSPQRTLKSTLRRLHKASGLDGRVRLAFTDCLGPCSEANVILLYLHGRPLWFRRMNAPGLISALLDYSRAAATDAGPALPPSSLPARSPGPAGASAPPRPSTPQHRRKPELRRQTG